MIRDSIPPPPYEEYTQETKDTTVTLELHHLKKMHTDLPTQDAHSHFNHRKRSKRDSPHSHHKHRRRTRRCKRGVDPNKFKQRLRIVYDNEKDERTVRPRAIFSHQAKIFRFSYSHTPNKSTRTSYELVGTGTLNIEAHQYDHEVLSMCLHTFTEVIDWNLDPYSM
eukprot:182020_1